MRSIAAIVLAIALAAAAHAETLSGAAEIVDGDTLIVDGERVRLWGIDAPERNQPCHHVSGEGEPWSCHDLTVLALSLILETAGHVARCETRYRDRYERIVATCSAGPVADIGRELVKRGVAYDYARYSDGYYAREQMEARTEGRGIHAFAVAAPHVWRRHKADPTRALRELRERLESQDREGAGER